MTADHQRQVSAPGDKPAGSGKEQGSALARQIDRLALCVHPRAGRRPELSAGAASLALPRPSILVVAARALAAGRLELDDVALMMRYDSPGAPQAVIATHEAAGILTPSGSGWTPISVLADLARLVLRLQTEEAEALWEQSDLDLADLATEARVHVEVALGHRAGFERPALAQQVRLHTVLPDSHSGQLLGYLTELRYLRSDVHAACLAREGLGGPSARVLHRLWKSFAVPEGDRRFVDDLIDAGLASPGPTITAVGREALNRVEAETDQLFGQQFESIAWDEQNRFLSSLQILPGEDPRPSMDR